jgi:hypothetical protein
MVFSILFSSQESSRMFSKYTQYSKRSKEDPAKREAMGNGDALRAMGAMVWGNGAMVGTGDALRGQCNVINRARQFSVANTSLAKGYSLWVPGVIVIA